MCIEKGHPMIRNIIYTNQVCFSHAESIGKITSSSPLCLVSRLTEVTRFFVCFFDFYESSIVNIAQIVSQNHWIFSIANFPANLKSIFSQQCRIISILYKISNFFHSILYLDLKLKLYLTKILFLV